MKKIAFLVAGLNAGGTENYLLRFLCFYENKIEATVYCKSGQLGELAQEYKDAGATLVPFRLGYLSISSFNKLKQEFQKNRYETVCDLTGSFGAFPLLMAKKAGVERRVAFFRNSKEKFKKTYFRMKYQAYINKLLPQAATKILSNSRTAFNYFYGTYWIDKDQFRVIYNGIEAAPFVNNDEDLRVELNIPSAAFVVGHVGRYNEQKNHKTAIKVALQLCEENNDIYFLFCGKDVDVNCQKLITSSKKQEQIKLLGVRRDIPKVLHTMNCFYFPSTIEGQPNALIEAMIVGLPFVASNIEPIKETVPEKCHEQLIEPKSIEEAKQKIVEIKNNRQFGETLNMSKWAQEYYKPEKWFTDFFEQL